MTDQNEATRYHAATERRAALLNHLVPIFDEASQMWLVECKRHKWRLLFHRVANANDAAYGHRMIAHQEPVE